MMTKIDAFSSDIEVTLEMEVKPFIEFLIGHYSLKKTKVKLSFEDL